MTTLRFLTLSLSLAFVNILFAQGGGMWIPNELPEKDMKNLGLQLNAQEIFANDSKTSVHNAIAHFGGGCTSEVISPKGLLLTNHHCGYGEIQSHSTIENDYLTDGFWAMSLEEELPNEGLTATFIIRIEKVTDQVFENITSETSSEAAEEIKQANIKKLQQNTQKEDWQEAEIKPFYDGNEYYLFVTETFKDVRLVGAPPSSIGKFGSDTDNWVWPRHTGDFSIFRIYADKNNRPAEYSPDNVPYKPHHYLPISVKGINEGDFTMVFGFPGRTQEYLPAAAIEQITQVLNPAKIAIREAALDIMKTEMLASDEVRIQYASKQARIANYWKKWIGENQGIEKSGAIALRKAYETTFEQRVNQKTKWKQAYGDILHQFDQKYQEIEPYALTRDYFDEALYRNSETFRIALVLNNLIKIHGTPNYEPYKNRVLNYLTGLYKDYNAQVDTQISNALLKMYFENVPPAFLPNGLEPINVNAQGIIPSQKILELLTQEDDVLMKELKQDELVTYMGKIEQQYESTVSGKYLSLKKDIDQLQKTYMKAQLEVMQDQKTFFPDANSTLRVTYGQVKGYEPRDAVSYGAQTHLDGVIEKYQPGDYEFDVSDKLIKLYNEKDYGTYAQDGKLPVNFIATNHTTGGNSGSPALDAHGNLIGLNFDRVWEGTMSDLHYDPEICRNIMVDSRYILFVIDKYAGASHLIDEMTLVK